MMQYVPTIGWAWRCSDIIFLSRNWQEDKSVMQTQVTEFYDYPYPVWVSTCRLVVSSCLESYMTTPIPYG